MSDFYLFTASLLYFAALSVVVAATSLAAFGRELIPFSPRPSAQADAKSRSANPPVI
jgi:hypothetical protein